MRSFPQLREQAGREHGQTQPRGRGEHGRAPQCRAGAGKRLRGLVEVAARGGQWQPVAAVEDVDGDREQHEPEPAQGGNSSARHRYRSRLKARTASGMNSASIAAQTRTRCSSWMVTSAPAMSPRIVSAAIETGFHSITGCSQAGTVAVFTNAPLRIVSGSIAPKARA